MAKRKPAHRAGTYQAIYDALTAVKTLNFKPARVRQYAPDPETGRKVYVRTVNEFTPQQKATLARMAYTKNYTDDGDEYLTKSHLYNLASGVANGEFEFVKIGGKDKKKKAKFMRDSGFFVTDKGTFNTRQNAKKTTIVKSAEGYRLSYTVESSAKPAGRGSRVDFKTSRREMFVPFPKSIHGNPEAIDSFIRKVNAKHRPNEVRVAVNGHQGLTAYAPKELFKYISGLTDDLGVPQDESVNPFINGFYLVFKTRVTEFKRPKVWQDPSEKKRIRKTGRK